MDSGRILDCSRSAMVAIDAYSYGSMRSVYDFLCVDLFRHSEIQDAKLVQALNMKWISSKLLRSVPIL